MSFATPLFLLAVFAGLIPVLLHMISRQKAPVMPFSTLQFLQNSVQRTRRRKQIHDLLLLLLRIAALVLIAIALARPAIQHLGGLLGQQAERAIVLILDNSASLATADETGPRWKRAIDVAEQLVSQLTTRDSIGLLLTCGPKTPEWNRLYRNHETIYQALNACQVRHEKADLMAKVQAAQKLLHNAKTPHKEIYVVTDMQAVSWNVADAPVNQKKGQNNRLPDNAKTSKTSSRTPTGRTDIPIVVIDVHGPPLPNAAIADISIDTTAPVAGVPVDAKVTVLGDRGIDQQKHVELFLGGKKISTSPTLAIGAGETKSHTFQFSPEQTGVLRGEFRLIGDDACLLDNRRFFSLVVNPHISVAIVQANDHDIAYLQDAFYLERALTPLESGLWAIRATKLKPQQLLSDQLTKYNAVFCVNVPAFDSTTIQKLSHYVAGGGHLIWTCGKNVDPAQYNAMNEQADAQLIPAHLTGIRGPAIEAPNPRSIGWLDAQYPVFTPLIEPASLYQSVLVHTHVQMALPEVTNARVLARLNDGEPLLVEQSHGKGSILFLGTSVHVDWTNLPLRPLFLPLVSRTVFHLADSHTSSTQCIAGEPFPVPISADHESAVEVIRPPGTDGIQPSFRFSVEDLIAQDKMAKENPKSNGTPWKSFHYTDTHDVGVYEMHVIGSDQIRQLAFAANLDSAELDTAFLDSAQLKDQLGSRHLVYCNDPQDWMGYLNRLREGKGLWELFLIAVLAALVAEAYVANRRVSLEIAGQPSRQPAKDWARRLRQQPEKITIPADSNHPKTLL